MEPGRAESTDRLKSWLVGTVAPRQAVAFIGGMLFARPGLHSWMDSLHVVMGKGETTELEGISRSSSACLQRLKDETVIVLWHNSKKREDSVVSFGRRPDFGEPRSGETL